MVSTFASPYLYTAQTHQPSSLAYSPVAQHVDDDSHHRLLHHRRFPPFQRLVTSDTATTTLLQPSLISSSVAIPASSATTTTTFGNSYDQGVVVSTTLPCSPFVFANEVVGGAIAGDVVGHVSQNGNHRDPQQQGQYYVHIPPHQRCAADHRQSQQPHHHRQLSQQQQQFIYNDNGDLITVGSAGPPPTPLHNSPISLPVLPSFSSLFSVPQNNNNDSRQHGYQQSSNQSNQSHPHNQFYHHHRTHVFDSFVLQLNRLLDLANRLSRDVSNSKSELLRLFDYGVDGDDTPTTVATFDPRTDLHTGSTFSTAADATTTTASLALHGELLLTAATTTGCAGGSVSSTKAAQSTSRLLAQSGVSTASSSSLATLVSDVSSSMPTYVYAIFRIVRVDQRSLSELMWPHGLTAVSSRHRPIAQPFHQIRTLLNRANAQHPVCGHLKTDAHRVHAAWYYMRRVKSNFATSLRQKLRHVGRIFHYIGSCETRDKNIPISAELCKILRRDYPAFCFNVQGHVINMSKLVVKLANNDRSVSSLEPGALELVRPQPSSLPPSDDYILASLVSTVCPIGCTTR